MISIEINGEKQSNDNIKEQWIAEQINNRLHDNQSLCVTFEIRCGNIDVIIPSSNCPSTDNVRPISSFNTKTRQVIERWHEIESQERGINTGMVIKFWEYLKRLCH